MENRATMNKPFCIIYADLDNFKIFNDVYGFKNGDQIIILLSKILKWSINRHGKSQDFIGHIGGDDFVILTSPDKAERICQGITRCFQRLVKKCYNRQDRNRGWVKAKGRDGIEYQYPLVSVSLGIIGCQGQCNLRHIGERAASIKKYSKSIPGNSYVSDRRSPIGRE